MLNLDFLKFHFLFNSFDFASTGVFDCLIIAITSSIFSIAIKRPIKIWDLSLAFFKSKRVLFITVFSLNFTKISINCLRFNNSGFFSLIARVLKPKELSKGENLYN